MYIMAKMSFVLVFYQNPLLQLTASTTMSVITTELSASIGDVTVVDLRARDKRYATVLCAGDTSDDNKMLSFKMTNYSNLEDTCTINFEIGQYVLVFEFQTKPLNCHISDTVRTHFCG